MNLTAFILVNSRTGDFKLLKRPPITKTLEYVFKLNIQLPNNPTPVINITVPVPATPVITPEIKDIPFGILWALAEKVIQINGLDKDGKAILEYTDTGFERLYKESQPSNYGDMLEYARQKWGLPYINCIQMWEKKNNEKSQPG